MLLKIKSSQLNEKTLEILDKIKNFKNFEFIISCLEIEENDFNNYADICNSYKNIFDLFTIKVTDDLIKRGESLTELILETSLHQKKLYIDWESEKSREFCELAKSFYNSECIELKHNYNEVITNKNLTNINLNVFAEVFEEISSGNLLSAYLHTLELNIENLKIKNNFNNKSKDITIDLFEFDLKWKDILIKIKKDILSFEEYLLDNYYEYPFTFEVYEPIFDMNKNMVQDILSHKWKMFEFISSLKCEDVFNLHPDLILKLNQNEFIPFNEILEIVEGDYPFLKYYKEMEGII